MEKPKLQLPLVRKPWAVQKNLGPDHSRICFHSKQNCSDWKLPDKRFTQLYRNLTVLYMRRWSGGGKEPKSRLSEFMYVVLACMMVQSLLLSQSNISSVAVA